MNVNDIKIIGLQRRTPSTIRTTGLGMKQGEKKGDHEATLNSQYFCW